ncbi:methylated-DNA--[protein]-cysteine S-methyltransferase [Salibacterium salarium]|uniref:Methylated-DNA--protein-cysteine methyltransferase n=1 Tax=Salibacterium salarium TaxID=284579 RepID=A0A3R9QVK4_9BACI|nr:methylated-DNA--[protein]-cysteine S-methyltransferase [Salibacterium salarium]RSL34331.1 methylated-DNA--[protein]-cysteine S-methyltransferase [Salibacterium salarium]
MEEAENYLFYSQMNTSIGPITIAASNKGVCALYFGESEEIINGMKPWIQKYKIGDAFQEDTNILEVAKKQLHEYFDGDRTEFDMPLDLYGTSFQRSTWKALQQIPYGETRSYKQIAEEIGSPRAVRAIGSANNKNPISIIVPCHRVIGSNGTMVGYGSGIDKKEYLLRLEGALQPVSS